MLTAHRMDLSFLEQPVVMPPATLRPATTPAEAARLLGLDPSAYWLEIARELVWDRPPEVALEGGLGDFRYFPGATGNVSVNCLDRWPAERVACTTSARTGSARRGPTVSSPTPPRASPRRSRTAGSPRGDRVAIFAGNVPEAFIAIHACYRIGAIYSVIFSGFSASAVRDRLLDSSPKAVVVTDATLRRGKAGAAQGDARRGHDGLDIPTVIVARRVDRAYPLRAGELDFAELLASTTRRAAPVPLEANEPGFIIYTSGTSSKPKGLVHSGIGFLVATYANVKWSMALGPDDSYWCTADVGWLALPVFAVVGGLANGGTHVIFEGSLDTPSLARTYEMIARYRVTKLFTAPTVLRMLRRAR